MSVAEDVDVAFQSHAVSADILLLFALDVLKKLILLIEFMDGTLYSPRNHWRGQLMQKLGHLSIECSSEFYNIEPELRQTHRHFHPL